MSGKKKTEIIDGACFGYYDKEFKECLSCKVSKACSRATASEKRDKVIKSSKDSTEEIKKLVLEWEE